MSVNSSDISIIEDSFNGRDETHHAQYTPVVIGRPGVISESDDSFAVTTASTPNVAQNKHTDITNWRETHSSEDDSPIGRRRPKPKTEVIVIDDDSDSDEIVQVSDGAVEVSSFAASSVSSQVVIVLIINAPGEFFSLWVRCLTQHCPGIARLLHVED